MVCDDDRDLLVLTGESLKDAGFDVFLIDKGAKVISELKKWDVDAIVLDVKMADIMSKIEDNAEAASFIWDWIYGDNDLNPSEYHEGWKKC